jgi:hypothetical protein
MCAIERCQSFTPLVASLSLLSPHSHPRTNTLHALAMTIQMLLQ